MTDADLVMIRGTLAILREARGRLRVFGAEAHKFQAHPPLSAQEVHAFEARYAVALPPDYRRFLLDIGDGGAGPAYGVFKLGEMDDALGQRRWTEGDGLVGILSKPFPHVAPWNDLADAPDEDAADESDPEWEDKYERQLDAFEKAYWNTAHIDGAIPICHLGCAQRQWLVLTGPEAGNVWDDRRADRDGLTPVQRPRRERLTFLQWHQVWLEEALAQL